MFITLYIYINDKSGPIPRRIRIESFGAGDAHIATRFAPVAPQGHRYALGEHGIALRRLEPTRAPRGAFHGAWRL